MATRHAVSRYSSRITCVSCQPYIIAHRAAEGSARDLHLKRIARELTSKFYREWPLQYSISTLHHAARFCVYHLRRPLRDASVLCDVQKIRCSGFSSTPCSLACFESALHHGSLTHLGDLRSEIRRFLAHSPNMWAIERRHRMHEALNPVLLF